MSSLVSNASVAAQWRAVRRLYPIYTALAERFGLGTPPYENLQLSAGESESAVIARVEAWLGEMDERIQPHQFRQMLQSSGFANAEDKLHALVLRHLAKPGRNEADRDKLDFLLTQYLAIGTPPSFHGRDLSLEDVALVLEPVLGEGATGASPWTEPLENVIEQMRQCQSLQQFEALEVVQHGRDLKASAADEFFAPSSLLVFTRFSYFVRSTFARLLGDLVRSIELELHELEENGINTIDGTEIGLVSDEPLKTVRELLRSALNSALPSYSSASTSQRIQTLAQIVSRSLPRNQTALTAADRSRMERVEAEVGTLRTEIAQLRALYAQFCAGLAEQAGRLLTPDAARISAARSREAEREAEREIDLTLEAASIPHEHREAAAPPADNNGAISADGSAAAVPDATNPPAETITAETAPPSGAPQSPAEIKAEVDECLARIRKALRAPGAKPSGVLRIRTGTVLLTEGELQSLQNNDDSNDPVSRMVETSIGTRALLVEKCELGKAGQAVDFAGVMQMARELHNDLQKLAGERGPKHETVSGSARQLWSVLQQAERTARQMRQTANGG